MHPLLAVILFPLLAIFAYLRGRRKITLMMQHQGVTHAQALPGYYGAYVALWTVAPLLLLSVLWLTLADNIIMERVIADLSPRQLEAVAEGFDFFPDKVRKAVNSADGITAPTTASTDYDRVVSAAALLYHEYERKSTLLFWLVAVLLTIVSMRESLDNVAPEFRARHVVDRYARGMLFTAALVSVLITAAIVGSVLFESLRFFQQISPADFLLGLQWSPQTALRADQAASSGAFGVVPLFVGTFLITGVAMLVAVPLGLFSAIYMAEYAHRSTRAVTKPLLEMLAGIPTVVYGYFAIVTLSPWLREFGDWFGLSVSSESALGAGLVMGIMIIPFISSLSDDIITAVPQSLRQASMGLGATRSETIRKVVLPAALPGIMGAVLLGISRAIGETMIVVMAAGLAANITFNPLDSVTTVTAQIVSLLTGDQEFDSAKTLAAFALGLTLFVVTLLLNIVALLVVKKYRENYE